ncbi:MAG: carboxypeptidase regulatory-like domain-containing protein, partial [Bryobacteraceae bacterium]|nr:carboxypeptidase regulatory-like domain-containing protein [Bryobacteraceae bacterium]
MSTCWELLICFVFWSVCAWAQTSTGQITGTVFDTSGAVVPGATVDLKGAETGDLVRTLTTDETGSFTAPLLRPGAYAVEVTVTGFKRLLRSGIQLSVDEVLNLRLTVEPGVTSESVTVAASAEMLEEKTNSVGQVVGEHTIQQLPLNGRNYLQLGALTAGAVPSDRSRDRSFAAYGNRGLQNAFLLDGARNQNYLRGLDNRARDAMRPSLEAIAEFKVQTSNFSAEYGASAAAVVNVVTKGGTNEIHGSAFEFLRNSAFDARDFFLPSSSDKPLYIQHQFGGSLGGPVVKNRAWWHGAFQRTHISEGETDISTLPTLSERNGVFTVPVFDPDTTRANPDGAGFVRDPFPGNVIPATRFNPIGKALLERFPAPNLPGTARNYVDNPLQATRANNATFRGDLRISDHDLLFGRFSFDDGAFLRVPPVPEPAQTGTNRDQPSRSVGIGYTRTISPSVVNELRFAWNRVAVDQDATLAYDEILPGALAPGVNSSIPTFGLTGYAGLGAQPANFGNLPLTKSSGVWNVSDNLSMIRGRHTIKAGFDFQVLRITTATTLNGRGNFGFNGVFTQDPQRRPGTGSPVADMLLGLPHTITLGTRSISNERTQNYYWYIQDDWTITPTFTLNLGVRYELTRPFYEANDRLGNLVLDAGGLYGQLILAGDERRPRSLLDTDYNNWAPRVGFAWRTPAPDLVVRGGYGIFYGQDEGYGVTVRMTNNPPFVG